MTMLAERIDATKGRISAKRLLPLCRAEGYTGSDRSLRRAVASAKAEHRRSRRIYRPWQPVPGEHLVFDWGTEEGPLKVFCAVLAWSRWRFVRFAEHQDQATTLRLLAECFELLGGVPEVLLTDRMGCLKGGVVADVMVPAPGYVAFAAHYGVRPDFCAAGDPESKGVVEHLVGYAKSDLVTGLGPWSTIDDANAAAGSWCAEVNGRRHSEVMAVPDERLLVERTLLGSLPDLRPVIGSVETRSSGRQDANDAVGPVDLRLLAIGGADGDPWMPATHGCRTRALARHRAGASPDLEDDGLGIDEERRPTGIGGVCDEDVAAPDGLLAGTSQHPDPTSGRATGRPNASHHAGRGTDAIAAESGGVARRGGRSVRLGPLVELSLHPTVTSRVMLLAPARR